jgi:hypothetical protein
MIVIKGETHSTIGDAAKKFGVVPKTVRDWIENGIIPRPPKVRRGLQNIQIFPPEYMKIAERKIEEHSNRDRSLNK